MTIPQAENRGKSVQAAANLFDYEALQTPATRQVGVSFARLAAEMIGRHQRDTPQLVKALKSLKDARDAFVAATEAELAPAAAKR